MTRFTKASQRLLTARSVLMLFGFQMVLLIVSMLKDVPLSPDRGTIDTLVLLVIEEARLVNAAIDFLLFSPSYSGDLDLLFGFLALPVVYYLTAIAVALSGRAVYRLCRKRFSA